MRKLVPGCIVFVLLVALVACAGCLGSSATVQDATDGAIHTHYQSEDSWNFEYGCYNHITGYVYNTGKSPTEDLRLNFNLINNESGTIRDSRSVFVGNLGAGETKTFETALDGECTQDYRVEYTLENI